VLRAAATTLRKRPEEVASATEDLQARAKAARKTDSHPAVDPATLASGAVSIGDVPVVLHVIEPSVDAKALPTSPTG
jgi:hypothetical protein